MEIILEMKAKIIHYLMHIYMTESSSNEILQLNLVLSK